MNLFDILTYSKLILLPSAQRGEYHPWWGPGMMGSWGSGWMGWFGSVMHLLFWGLVVFVLFLLARRLWSSSQSSSEVMRNESPMDILKRRYASGEIDREEFEQKKQDLSSISPWIFMRSKSSQHHLESMIPSRDWLEVLIVNTWRAHRPPESVNYILHTFPLETKLPNSVLRFKMGKVWIKGCNIKSDWNRG